MADNTEKTTTTEKSGHQLQMEAYDARLEAKALIAEISADILDKAELADLKIPTFPKKLDLSKLIDDMGTVKDLRLMQQTYNLCRLTRYTKALSLDTVFNPKEYTQLLYLASYSWSKVSLLAPAEKDNYLKGIKSTRINYYQRLFVAELVHDFLITAKKYNNYLYSESLNDIIITDTLSDILLSFFELNEVKGYEKLLSTTELLRLLKLFTVSLQDVVTTAYEMQDKMANAENFAERDWHKLWEFIDSKIDTTVVKARKPTPVVPINILEQNYFPLLNIPATQDIAKSAGQIPMQEGILEKLFVKIGDTKINLTDISNADKIIKPSTCKLLDTVVGLFTANNKGQHKKENDQLNTTVCISLDSYCRACGYVKVPKEDELYKTQIDNARKKIHKDLNVLHKATISFKEKGKDFFDRNLISGKGILKGNIIVDLDAKFAKTLYMAGEMKFHPALLKIDERCSSTFALGRKLCQHYSLDNNVIRGSNKRLSIKVLLETCLDIPRPEDLTNRHWRKRIIEPLEKRLCDLEEAGVLEEWHYCEAKGTPIPNDKITIPTLDYFLNKLYIDFKIKDFNLIDERFIAKQEAKAKRAEAKAKAPRRPRKPKAE